MKAVLYVGLYCFPPAALLKSLFCCDGIVRGGFWQGAVFHEPPDYV